MIKSPSKQESLLNELVKLAKFDSLLHMYPRKVGGMIDRLSDEDRNLINLLKEEDVQNVRGDIGTGSSGPR